MTLASIFEREVLILVYYLVFSSLAGALPQAWIQALFLSAGLGLQAWLKHATRVGSWKHFSAWGFYLLGTWINHGQNTLGNGIMVFLLAVALLSWGFERFQGHLKQRPWMLGLASMAHSAVVFTAFPVLYSLFLLHKKGIRLADFMAEKEHFLVFLGYSTFYLSVVISKQLLSIQNALLRRKCQELSPSVTASTGSAGTPTDGSSTHSEGG